MEELPEASDPAAWRPDDLTASEAWRHTFTGRELAELLAVARETADAEEPVETPALPVLSPEIEKTAHELKSGPGFRILRGLPVKELGKEGVARASSTVKIALIEAVWAFSLIFVTLTPSAAAESCAEYTGGRVMERTVSDQRAHGRLLAPDAHLTAVGDFDGDGRTDQAFFTNVSGHFVVVACLEEGKRAVRMPWPELPGRVFCCYGIHTLAPDIHLARCLIGYDLGCATAELELDHDAIGFFRYESAGGFFYWSDGRFKEIWTSD